MVCNGGKVEEVNFKWKWGDKELPRVDQYTCLGVEVSKDCTWDVHMKKVTEKGKARVGKSHPIVADRNLDPRIKTTFEYRYHCAVKTPRKSVGRKAKVESRSWKYFR